MSTIIKNKQKCPNLIMRTLFGLSILIIFTGLSSNLQPQLASAQQWQTYKDPGNGITLAYPPDWIVEPFRTGQTIPELEKGFMIYPPDKAVAIILIGEIPKEVPFNFYDVEIKDLANSIIAYQQQSIDGLKVEGISFDTVTFDADPNNHIPVAVLEYTKPNGVKMIQKSFVSPYDEKLYHIIANVVPDKFEKYEPTMQQILASLDFDFTWSQKVEQKVNEYWVERGVIDGLGQPPSLEPLGKSGAGWNWPYDPECSERRGLPSFGSSC
jgi:hypothetical protein